MFHGDKLYIQDHFLEDEKNTHVQTVLLMRVGSGGSRGEHAHGIHWHVSPEHKTFYMPGLGGENTIGSIMLLDHDGKKIDFISSDDEASEKAKNDGQYKLMDCLDCHNRPTHVFLSPEDALDRKISEGLISRNIPFIKQRALEAIKKNYTNKIEARKMISLELENWYKSHYPQFSSDEEALLDEAVNSIYQAWSENVFPEKGTTFASGL